MHIYLCLYILSTKVWSKLTLIYISLVALDVLRLLHHMDTVELGLVDFVSLYTCLVEMTVFTLNIAKVKVNVNVILSPLNVTVVHIVKANYADKCVGTQLLII